ncbi:stage II sporulation protein M [Andreprevotia chitinilytica]|uniref:stage II sporulation protein M n=1 Tax=Andreprevotia chitinilytica TaxID=396808 RepID=UPI0005587F2F|nr:stage II sporulation protein M [Andreprevotia chitinilytica]
MKQRQFEARHSALWEEVEAELTSKKPSPTLPSRYRALCHTLAVARQRGYSPSLVARLDALAINTHRAIYSEAGSREYAFIRWLKRDFPRLVRAEWRVVWISIIAFFGVAALTGGLIAWKPEIAYAFTPPHELASYEAMYQKGAHRLARRGEADDVMMFGFYIWNNVSIVFRTFAGGLLFGLGALYATAFNGLHLGVIGAWLSRTEATRDPFWSFVVTHTAFEVTGLILAGAAGLKLGGVLIAPGRMTRVAALRTIGPRILPMLSGAALLTFMAAFIEGFWSARTDVPSLAKYIVGGCLWFAVICYFSFAGRDRAA